MPATSRAKAEKDLRYTRKPETDYARECKEATLWDTRGTTGFSLMGYFALVGLAYLKG